MSKFITPLYNSLKEYVPGEQPQDKKYIKLNTNESPFPPSPVVIECVNSEAVKNLKLYSDPESKVLKEELAKAYDVLKENVFVSNGSDEILNFAFMAYAREQGVAFSDITYGFYKVFAELYNVQTKIIPLKEDFTIDYKDYINLNKMIVIANPNAPTGISLKLNEIEEIIKSNPQNVVVIDEAYVDFGGTSALNLINKYDNLLIVRTYSKSRSMAGARLGYAFGNKEIIADLEKIKYSTNPYNVNRLTQIAGIASLMDNEYYENNCNDIMINRESTVKELKKLGFFVLPSDANFIFVKHPDIQGEDLYLKLKDKGILIRHFTQERIKDFNRITIGTLEEMHSLILAIKEILEEI
ncbi:MAG: histidinol-phosphate transaminase [Clostridiales bacterium]|nr:histidinol-phosphate transaminase [Clostridiales bacterium]